MICISTPRPRHLYKNPDSFCPAVCLSICLFVCPVSDFLSFHPFVCQFVCLCVRFYNFWTHNTCKSLSLPTEAREKPGEDRHFASITNSRSLSQCNLGPHSKFFILSFFCIKSIIGNWLKHLNKTLVSFVWKKNQN